MYEAVTYFPDINAFVEGDHTSKPPNWERLEMPSVEVYPIGTVKLDVRCDNPGMMKLIQTYGRVMKLQQDRLCLDRMFSSPSLGRLESDKHWEIPFDSQNADSYDVPDILTYAMPGSESLSSDIVNALLLKRERKAFDPLQLLGRHYRKDGDGEMKFRLAAAPTDNDVQRISNPVDRYTYDNTDTLREILECRAAFEDTFERRLTSIACSLNTAAKLTWCTPMYEKIESACGTIGTVCEFPGMGDVRMVASGICPHNVLYAASEHALLKHEGPKIISQSQPGIQAVRDFNLYKGAHEDPSEDRTLGFIIDLQTT